MTNRQAKRKMTKMVVNVIKSLYTNCKETAKQWNVNVIPLNVLNNYVDAIKLNIKDENEEFMLFVDAHNKVCESLKSTFKTSSNEMKSHGVSLEFIKYSVDTIIESYKQGATT